MVVKRGSLDGPVAVFLSINEKNRVKPVLKSKLPPFRHSVLALPGSCSQQKLETGGTSFFLACNRTSLS